MFGELNLKAADEKIYGKGSNLLPMIHVKDLCQIANIVAFKQFDTKKNWHFACD